MPPSIARNASAMRRCNWIGRCSAMDPTAARPKRSDGIWRKSGRPVTGDSGRLSRLRPQLLGRDHFPGLVDMNSEFIVIHMPEVDSNPAADAHIRRFEICFGIFSHQLCLNPGSLGQPDGNMSVVVVVV